MGWDWVFTSPAAQIMKGLGGGSEARQKAKMYEKVEKELNEKIVEIQGQLTNVEDALNLDYNTLSTGGDAEGQLKSEYDHQLETWQSRCLRIVTQMRNGLANARNMKSSVYYVNMIRYFKIWNCRLPEFFKFNVFGVVAAYRDRRIYNIRQLGNKGR